MTYAVTVNAGLKNVVLPDGLRHQGGDVVTLTDEQYGMLSPGALASLVSSAGDAAAGKSLVALPSAAYTAAQSPAVFSTVGVSELAVDITVSSVTGGTSPTLQFFLERQAADGLWYLILNTPPGATSPTSFTFDVGPFSLAFGGTNSAQHMVFTSQARLRWTYAGSPTSFTFSASVFGR